MREKREKGNLCSTSSPVLQQEREHAPLLVDGLIYEVGSGASAGLKPPRNYVAPPEVPCGAQIPDFHGVLPLGPV